MGTITSGVGLISGINSKDIIDQLMAIEEQPKTVLQSRKDKLTQQQSAYDALGSKIASLEATARTLQRPSTFTATTATSSDDKILTATTTRAAAVGSYQFNVAQVVTSQQSITSGYSSTSSTVKAGSLTIEAGGGGLDKETALSDLNGGAGVRRGSFRITDRSGNSAVIDTTAAISLDDVVKKINTSLDISVHASIKDDQLVLTDATGATTNNLSVSDLGDGHSAADLGIVQNVAADTLTGTDINGISSQTALSLLNDGNGVQRASTGPDLAITAGDGSTTNVTLGPSLSTVGDVIDAINTASGGKFTASVTQGSNAITITNKAGGGTLSVANGAGSKAASDLGLVKSSSGGVLTGDDVVAGLDSVLLRSLNGGSGLPTGTITIKDRSGTSKDIDLSGAKSVQSLLDTINSSGAAVTASLNSAGNGIQITAADGTGNLVISDKTGTAAAALGIAGTFDPTTPSAVGKNLQLKWVSANTALSSYNGGKGVTPGAFRITNSNGAQTTIDLSDTDTVTTIGDVIDRINASGAGVTASINTNGDGLLLTDTAGGPATLKVENSTGTTAKDLNILGTATGTTIDGSFEKTIAIDATDTLDTVKSKINTLGFGVSANIINDGSGSNPYHLSLNAYNSGKAGQVTIDAGTTGLDASTLVKAKDAAVFVGSADSDQPLLITSSTHQLANVVPGVNITLNGASTSPVTLNIAQNSDDLVKSIQSFVDSFNDVITSIDTQSQFDATTKTGGLLLGDATAEQVENQLYTVLSSTVTGTGRYSSLADLGITITNDPGTVPDTSATDTTDPTSTDPTASTDTTDTNPRYVAKLDFDTDKFQTALATDPSAVSNLFTQLASGLNTNTPLASLNTGTGVRTAGVGKSDFKIGTADGSSVNVTIPGSDSAPTLNDAINAINTAAGGKVLASVNSSGTGLTLVDKTTGTKSFGVTTQNGSSAATDLGITGTGIGGTIGGSPIFANTAKTGGGLGYLIEQQLNQLTDPVNGVITREDQTITQQSADFDQRMADIDTLVASKRARLEEQFNNMESVLAGLQSQQSALAGLGSSSTSTSTAA